MRRRKQTFYASNKGSSMVEIRKGLEAQCLKILPYPFHPGLLSHPVLDGERVLSAPLVSDPPRCRDFRVFRHHRKADFGYSSGGQSPAPGEVWNPCRPVAILPPRRGFRQGCQVSMHSAILCAKSRYFFPQTHSAPACRAN